MIVASFLLALALSAAAPAPDAAPPAAKAFDDEIIEAKVEGHLVNSEAEILALLGIKRGQSYNPIGVREGMKLLWQQRRVRVDEVTPIPIGPGSIRVLVRVTEQRRAAAVELRGNVDFERRELLDAVSIAASQAIDEVQADRIRRELARFYRDRGYLFANVELKIEEETRRAIYDVMEGPLVRIRSIEFDGPAAFPARTFLGLGKHLTTVMDLHGKFLFFRGSEFSERKLRQDLVQLRKFYRSEGYRDAVVDLLPPKFSEDGTAVDLTILVEEGPQYRVASIDIAGVESFPKDEILSKVRLKPGDPYTWEAVMRDFREIQRFYGEQGFPSHPSLNDRWQFKLPPQGPQEAFREDDEHALVDVTYEILEGSKKRIRDVRLSGNRLTQDRIVRRELGFHPGEVVNQTKIEQSIQQIDQLQYFDTATSPTSYRYVDTADPGWKDLEITVEEGRTGSLIFGGGISSNDGLFAQFGFVKRNFDLLNLPSSLSNALPEIIDSQAFTGGGQTLALSIAPGLQVSQFDLSFTEPDLFGDHQQTWALRTDVFFRVRRFTTHREDRLGQRVTLAKSLDDNWSIDTSLRNESIRLRDIEVQAPSLLFAQEGTSELRSLSVGLGYRDLDFPLDPREGLLGRIDHESAGIPLGGQLDFQKTKLQLGRYIPLGTDLEGHPHTLILRGNAGVAYPFGHAENIPYSERFFLGGEGTLRGFTYRGVGPVDLGEPIGGEASYVFTAEYRFPLFATRLPGRDEDFEVLRGVVFTDAGSVGLEPGHSSLGDLRASSGLGVRIRIPYLPQLQISVHLGVPWLREKTDDTRLVSFTVGSF